MGTFAATAGNSDQLERIAKGLSKDMTSIMLSRHDGADFGYTIGNTTRGYPELIMFGGTESDHVQLLKLAMSYQEHNEKVKDGADFPIVIVDGRLFKIKDVPLTKNVLSIVPMLQFFFHGKFELRQLVYTARGKFPWEEGYDRSKDRVLPCLWR